MTSRTFQIRPWLLMIPGLLGGTVLTAWTAPEPAGWYVGDMHVHRSCGTSPVSVASIYGTMTNLDLNVISLLADMGNGEVQNPVTDLPLVTGRDASISTPGRILHWDAEWHWDPVYMQYSNQALGGHLVALGLTNAHQIYKEYTYPIFQWAHQQGGIAGFAHLQYLDEGFPQSLSCCVPVEYPVEVALGSCDFVSEDVYGADSAVHAYYRLLNCGFRPGFAGGSDYPCNSQIGQTVTFVQVPGGLIYTNWIKGIKAGRTVVSLNGRNEFLDLKVNGSASPGDEIQFTGGGAVTVTVEWTANLNLSGTIELVRNGVVIASQPASVTPTIPATLSTMLNFTNSGWLCARRMDNNGHRVHTAAVFVTVDNKPVRASAADAQFYVQWMDNLLTLTSPGGAWSSYFVTNRAAAQARYTDARTIYQQIASQAVPLPVAITTVSLPNGLVNVPYSATLTASDGTAPYTWAITSGALPPGLTLNTNTGAIAGTPTVTATFNFTPRVSDASNPAQTATMPLAITINSIPASATIWPITTIPVQVDAGPDPDGAVELGVKFRSDVAGTITSIRFYKASANTGTHVGNLWTTNGTLLASATFTGETSSGWQQVDLPAPVAITANTVYVASYHANNGHYSEDDSYFSTGGVDNPPLHALANGVNGGNGVYAYGASSTFPTNTYDAANYWVDLVFLGNTAPVLPAQTNRTLVELTLLTVTNKATDSDIPANTLTYSLAVTNIGNNTAVTNASINTNGVISWTPTEAQGPGTNRFTTVVTDNGVPPLSATNSFTVTVNEWNSAPVLPDQTNRTLVGLQTLTVTNTASDGDLPANPLGYQLLGGPGGAAINGSGIITWTPLANQVPSTNVFTTVVTDTNVFAVNAVNLSATNSFVVFVNPAPIIPPPTLLSINLSNNIVTVTWSSVSNALYRLQHNEDLANTNWTSLSPDVLATGPSATTTDEAGVSTQKFYRVFVVPLP